MKTIREGTKSVSPDGVLDDRLLNGAMKYSVPTEMVMQKYLLAANYRPSTSWSTNATLPYLVNDMDMRMAMKSGMGQPLAITDQSVLLSTSEGSAAIRRVVACACKGESEV